MGSSAGHAGEDRSSVCMGLGGVERLGAGVSLITRAQASQGRATEQRRTSGLNPGLPSGSAEQLQGPWPPVPPNSH